MRGQVHHIGNVLLLCVVHLAAPGALEGRMIREGSTPGQSVVFPVRVDPETEESCGVSS
jgi:hypothetical protein